MSDIIAYAGSDYLVKYLVRLLLAKKKISLPSIEKSIPLFPYMKRLSFNYQSSPSWCISLFGRQVCVNLAIS